MDPTVKFDYVIVGGGSAGCILANRLSADPSVRVALVEAGVDTPPDAVPEAIADSYPMPLFHGERYIWPTLQARATRKSLPKVYEQGCVMGGGSSINVQSANRSLPRDYDEWRANGALGWGWTDVLPYFIRLESGLDFPDSPMHGHDGPVPIRRIARAKWPALCQGFAKGLEAIGMTELADQNGEFDDGYFATPFSNRDDRRATSASAYLDAKVRARVNLFIFSQTHVLSIEIDASKRVTGVIARNAQGERLVLKAERETILAAGALQTPALLLRAGIGDASALQASGVTVRHHLPGVGRNLQDHPSLTFCHFLPPAFRAPTSRARGCGQAGSGRAIDGRRRCCVAFVAGSEYRSSGFHPSVILDARESVESRDA